jgi:hypothetical protein
MSKEQQKWSGVKTIFKPAYLPTTALDWAPDEGTQADAARTIYPTIFTWSTSSARAAGMRTVVLGDPNETLTATDRQSLWLCGYLSLTSSHTWLHMRDETWAAEGKCC